MSHYTHEAKKKRINCLAHGKYDWFQEIPCNVINSVLNYRKGNNEYYSVL